MDWRRLLYWLTIALGLGVIGYAFYFIKDLKKPKIQAESMISEDADAVIEIENAKQTIKALNKNNFVWNELTKNNYLNYYNGFLTYCDSLFDANLKLEEMVAGKVYWKIKGTNNLIAFNLPSALHSDDFISLLSNQSGISHTGEIYELKVRNEVTYIYTHGGLVLCSNSKLEIDNCINTKIKSIYDNADFKALSSNVSKYPIKIIYKPNSIHQSLTFILRSSPPEIACGNYAVVNLSLETDKIIGSGQMKLDSTCSNSNLSHLENSNLEGITTLPSNTYSYKVFHAKFKLLAALNFDSQGKKDLASFINKEVINFKFGNLDSNLIGYSFYNEEMDSTELHQQLDEVIHDDGEINDSLMGYESLTQFQKDFEANYLFIDNNAILVFNTKEAYNTYKQERNSGKLLIQNEKLKQTIDISVPKEFGMMEWQLVSKIKTNPELQKTNLGAYIYYIKANKKFYENGFLIDYVQQNKSDENSMGECTLDDDINYFQEIRNISSGQQDILVTDLSNNFYLVNNKSSIEWRYKISSPLLGTFHQVDFFKNNKLQIMFNTKEYLYLIDKNGKDVEGYPIKLKQSATAGITVVDYDNSLTYRIFLPLGNKVVCLNSKGSKVDGFKDIQLQDSITSPIIYTKINEHDLIITTDRLGNSFLSDRKGILKFDLKNKLISAKFNILTRHDELKSSLTCFDSITNQLVNYTFAGQKTSKDIGISIVKNHYSLRALNGSVFDYYVNGNNSLYKLDKDKDAEKILDLKSDALLAVFDIQDLLIAQTQMDENSILQSKNFNNEDGIIIQSSHPARIINLLGDEKLYAVCYEGKNLKFYAL